MQASFRNYWANTQSRQEALGSAQYVIQHKGWLTLWGPYGNGKSYLGAAVVNECLRVGILAKHYDMADLLDFLRSGYNQPAGFDKRFSEVCASPCLVVDECDTFNVTEWAYEKFRQLVNARYKTSNLTITLWILNPEPVIGNPDLPPGLDFLASRMSEWPIIGVSDGDVRPHLKDM